jgi:hypothetical protein
VVVRLEKKLARRIKLTRGFFSFKNVLIFNFKKMENISCVNCGVPAQEVGGVRCNDCPIAKQLDESDAAKRAQAVLDSDPNVIMSEKFCDDPQAAESISNPPKYDRD